MDPTAVSNQTVSLLGGYLNRRAYGGQPESAMDSLYQLVAARLAASYVGQQALQGFAAAPHDASAQATLAAAITQEAARDWNFGSALAQATGQPQPATGAMPAAPAGWSGTATTPAAPAGWPGVQPGGQGFAGTSLRSKLTPGWIAAIVAGAAVLLIAVISTVVVIANQGGAYDEVAGTWVPDPATASDDEAALVLRITDDGEWTLEGFSLIGAFSCSGELARDQPSSYAMRPEEGICTSGSLRLDGDVLVMSGDGEELRFVRE